MNACEIFRTPEFLYIGSSDVVCGYYNCGGVKAMQSVDLSISWRYTDLNK